MKKTAIMIVAALAAVFAQAAFAPNPKGAFKALKGEKSKPIKTGMVFVDGKYLPPPYSVERYGLVLRVNKIQVTGPVIPWDEFVKTQEGVKVTKNVSGGENPETPGETPAEPEPEPEPEEEEEVYSLSFGDDDPLADLFDDEPSVKKPAAKKKASKPKPKKPVVTVTYSFDGEFKHNDKTLALQKKIMQARADIETILRDGGFVCFGSSYSRVTGDAGTARIVLGKLPGLMQSSPNAKALASGIRASGITFFPDALCRDLFQNRIDYRQLLERQKAVEEEAKLKALLKGGY